VQRLTRQRGAQLRTVARIARRLEPMLRSAFRALGSVLSPSEWLSAAATGALPGATSARIREKLVALEADLVRRLLVEALTESFFEPGPLERVITELERRGAPIPIIDSLHTILAGIRGFVTEQTTPEQLARMGIGRLIQQLEDEALAAVRLQLSFIADAGMTDETIGAIGQATGLTSRQVAQVERARRAALQAGANEAAAARTADGVRAKLLDQRARLIARHETVSFTNETILERGQQVAAAGSVVLKQSVCARDDHVDGGDPFGICRVLDDGKKIPIGEPFVFEGRTYQGPPYHVGCRDILELWVED
jgi:hypothetical protein